MNPGLFPPFASVDIARHMSGTIRNGLTAPCRAPLRALQRCPRVRRAAQDPNPAPGLRQPRPRPLPGRPRVRVLRLLRLGPQRRGRGLVQEGPRGRRSRDGRATARLRAQPHRLRPLARGVGGPGGDYQGEAALSRLRRRVLGFQLGVRRRGRVCHTVFRAGAGSRGGRVRFFRQEHGALRYAQRNPFLLLHFSFLLFFFSRRDVNAS